MASSRPGADGGGGFAEVGAYDPQTRGRIAVGGDVWGARISDNGGNSYHGTLWGSSSTPWCRALAFSKRPAFKGQCYLGAGALKGGTGTGGFWVLDGLKSRETNAVLGFGTAQTTAPDGNARPAEYHPRACGDQILVDYDAGSDTEYVYACLPGYGLGRCSDNSQFVNVVKMGSVADPASSAWKGGVILPSGNLLFCTYQITTTTGTIVYKVTTPRTTAAVTTIGAAPPVVCDLAVDPTTSRVFAACGASGVYEVTSDGAVWTAVPGNSFWSALHPSTIDFGIDGKMWVGTCMDGNGHDVAVSSDKGGSFSWSLSATSWNSSQWGSNQPWWLASGPNPSKPGFQAECVKCDPFDASCVTSFGISGSWQTRDGGATWRPSMVGMNGGEVSHLIAQTGGVFWADDTDYVAKMTNDNWQTVIWNQSAPAFGTAALTRTAAGHTFQVKKAVPCDITRDGVSIADDAFRAWVVNPTDLAVSPDGLVAAVAQSGGVYVVDVAAAPAPPPPPASPPPPSGAPQVGVIWLENAGYSAVNGSASAPFQNSEAAKYQKLTLYSGVDHPSLPNYLAATDGTEMDKSGTDSMTGLPRTINNIFDQLAAAGKTWKVYAERSGTYYPRHDPAAFYTVPAASPNHTDFPGTGGLFADITARTLPDFFWITPNGSNCGHDTSFGYADRWLAGLNPGSQSPSFPGLEALLAAMRPGGVVFVAYDEDGPANQVFAFIAGSAKVGAPDYSAASNHYSLLRGIQATFGLAKWTSSGNGSFPLNAAYSSATPIPLITAPVSPPPPPPAGTLIDDAFSRTLSGQWGTADTGQTWVIDSGSSGQFATDGSEGSIQSVANVTAIAHLPASLADSFVRARFRFSSNPVGAATSYGVGLRYVDANNHVRAIVTQSLTGTSSVQVQAVAAGVVSTLIPATTLPAQAPGSFYWLELQVLNGVWSVRVWPDGTARPATATASAASTAGPATGGVCIRQQTPAGNTNLPVTLVDDVQADSLAQSSPPPPPPAPPPAPPPIAPPPPVSPPPPPSTVSPTVGFETSLDGGAWSAQSVATSRTLTLADGPHSFAVRAVDASARVSFPTQVDFTVNTGRQVPLAPAQTSGPTDGSVTPSNGATFAFRSSTAGVTYLTSLDGAAFQLTASGGTATQVSYSNLAAGTHVFQVKARNTNGDSQITTVTWTVNPQAQAPPPLPPPPPPTSSPPPPPGTSPPPSSSRCGDSVPVAWDTDA